MIKGLLQILIWQAVGEGISKLLLPNIPGPVLGLLCLLIYLISRGEVTDSMAKVSAVFRQNLGLLFVPAAVGVVTFLPELKQHALAYITALIVSVVVTIAATGLVLKLLSKETPHE
jgi:holin-like protein